VKAEAAKLPGAGIGPKQCPESRKRQTHLTQWHQRSGTEGVKDGS
jgi:hypothetical protein